VRDSREASLVPFRYSARTENSRAQDTCRMFGIRREDTSAGEFAADFSLAKTFRSDSSVAKGLLEVFGRLNCDLDNPTL